MFPKQFLYPCPYADMVPLFARPIPQIRMASHLIMNNIFKNLGHLIKEFNQPWLTPFQSQRSASVSYEKGAPLKNYWRVIEGIMRPVCRPRENQFTIYIVHMTLYAIKCQYLEAPNGLSARLDDPYEGKNMAVE